MYLSWPDFDDIDINEVVESREQSLVDDQQDALYIHRHSKGYKHQGSSKWEDGQKAGASVHLGKYNI